MNNPFKNIFDRWFSTIREINNKYREPRIKITPGVRFALVALRVYLFVLIAIMLFKFITLLK